MNRRLRRCLRPGPAWLGLVLAMVLGARAATAGAPLLVEQSSAVLKLTMDEFVRLVLENNETLQIRILETEIARHRYLGEKGIFEPEFVATYDYLESSRENTVEQQRNLGVNVFEERNNIYSGGLEALVPSGARVRLGFTMRDLHNNLFSPIGIGSTGFTNQYSTFMGLTLTQPLLKNGWRAATLANIRIAALASDVAFQEYRRQLMLLISAAEAAYWNLYMAQEQLLFFRESVALAGTILHDNRARLETGRGSELEVLEAESGLALRKSRQSEALQLYFEAANRMAMLFSQSVANTNQLLIAVEEPEETDIALDFFRCWQNAFESNPDYLSQQKKLIQEKIRLAYAKNQRWPQLDLKASYGLNGLGQSPWESWDKVERGEYPTWSIGVELRVPLTGGRKVRHEYSAAQLRQKQALLSLKELETQILNSIDTAMRKVRSSRDSVHSYHKAVEFTQNLLDTQLARLEVGRVESRKVLETEADLFEAKNSLVEALVNFRRAEIELDLVQGTVLKTRQLELEKRELESRTAQLIRNGRLTDRQYRDFLRTMEYEYQKNAHLRPPPPPDWYYAKPIPGKGYPEAPPPMTQEQYEKVRTLLQNNATNAPPFQP